MAKGQGSRSQFKKERNEQTKDKRARATVSNVRIPSSKARIVLDTIRGKNVVAALGTLTYTPRNGARIIKTLLESAIANGENNDGLDASKLYVEEAYATQGPTLKRIRARAQGRAFGIDKQTSNITVILNER